MLFIEKLKFRQKIYVLILSFLTISLIGIFYFFSLVIEKERASLLSQVLNPVLKNINSEVQKEIQKKQDALIEKVRVLSQNKNIETQIDDIASSLNLILIPANQINTINFTNETQKRITILNQNYEKQAFNKNIYLSSNQDSNTRLNLLSNQDIKIGQNLKIKIKLENKKQIEFDYYIMSEPSENLNNTIVSYFDLKNHFISNHRNAVENFKDIFSSTTNQLIFCVLVLGFFGISVLLNYSLNRITENMDLILKGIKTYYETGYGYKIILKTQDEFSEIANQFNNIVDKAHESFKDPLTNCFNRRYYELEMEKLCLSYKRNNLENLSLAVIDIDHFKKINDTYGHQTGDEAIVFLSHVFNTYLRKSDTFVRYGGEEFILILRNSNLEGAQLFLENIRATVESTGFISQFSKKHISLTFSAGVCSVDNGDFDSQLLFKFADEALYKAKQKGRNRIEVHQAESNELKQLKSS